MRSVFVLGSINQDIVGFCPRHPLPGETIVGSRVERHPGGKGANQAVAASLAGRPCRMISAVGDDAAGRELLAFLASKNVDVSMVRRLDHAATGTALILVAADGQNSIVVIPGANAEVTAGDPGIAPSEGDVCLAQFEVPLASVEALFSRARGAAATTILNPSPFQAIPPGILANTDILIVNETEYAELGGRGVDRSRPVARRADVVTLGRSGVRLDTAGESVHIPGIAVDAVDTTGAGDCFAGYFAALLAEGASLCSAARTANAAAALSVTRPGAGSSIPTREEVNGFLARIDRE